MTHSDKSLLFVVALLSGACSSESHSDAGTTNVEATGGAGVSGGSAAQSGGAVSTGGTASVATGGTSAATSASIINGGRPATSWQPSACGGSTTLDAMSPHQLYYALGQSPRAFLLINVHVPVSGNIPGTDVDLTYQDIPAIEQFIGEDKSQPVVLYCMSNAMSNAAGPALIADGFCNVHFLDGGLSAWKDAGYAVDP